MKSSAMVPSRSSTLSAAFPVLGLCCLTLMQACSDSHTDSGGYPTGYEVGYRQRDSVFWVDETRLVFAGMPSAEMRAAISSNQPKAEERLKKLYLWDRKTKTATLYADAKFACFSKGNIRYATHIDEAAGKRTIREGPLGSEQETEVTVPVLTAVEHAEYASGMVCKSVKRSELTPPASPDHHIVVLHDGYLDFGPIAPGYLEQRDTPVKNLRLFSGRSGQATKLPMTWDQNFAPAETTFSAFRNAYVLHPRPSREQFKNASPLLVYLLWPDGRVESTSIPFTPAEYLTDPQPSKAGWIFGGGDIYKTAGLYLFTSERVSKLDAGLVQKIAVSPDGCTAAVVIQNKWLEGHSPFNLKVFELCK